MAFLKRTIARKLIVIANVCLSVRTRLRKLGISNKAQREKGYFFL